MLVKFSIPRRESMYAPARMIKTTSPGFDFKMASISDAELAEANRNFAEQELPYAVVRDIGEVAA